MTHAPLAQPSLRLIKEVSAGPMSAVFVGEKTTQAGDDTIVVKVLTTPSSDQHRQIEALIKHLAQLRLLNHRHIAPMKDVIYVNQHFALVSEFVDGLDLQDWGDILKETGVLMPRRVVCEIIRAVSVALDVAQNRVPQRHDTPMYISHRDLKPSNVMVDRDGELKVVDFCAGYTSLSGSSGLSGALQKGLIKYLAPERKEGQLGDGSADVYALGIMAIELFRGEWLKRIRSQNPAHDRYLGEVIANLADLQMKSSADDRTLRNIMLRMVAYDPESRPAITEVAATFRTLTDRAVGPSLESFAHAHALPWLEPLPASAEPHLSKMTCSPLRGSTSSEDYSISPKIRRNFAPTDDIVDPDTTAESSLPKNFALRPRAGLHSETTESTECTESTEVSAARPPPVSRPPSRPGPKPTGPSTRATLPGKTLPGLDARRLQAQMETAGISRSAIEVDNRKRPSILIRIIQLTVVLFVLMSLVILLTLLVLGMFWGATTYLI